MHWCIHVLPATAILRRHFDTIGGQALCMTLSVDPRLRQPFRHHGSSSQRQDSLCITESVLRLCSCCVEQSPGSQAFVDHLLVDHVDLVNRDLPSWVHAHIYATHLLDFLGEKRHHKVSDLDRFNALCACSFQADVREPCMVSAKASSGQAAIL